MLLMLPALLLGSVSCNKDTNELPPIEVKTLEASKPAYFSEKLFLEARLTQQIAATGETTTELSWKNVSGSDLFNVDVYYKLCLDNGTCLWEERYSIATLTKDSISEATLIYLPEGTNINDLVVTLEVLSYNNETYLLAGVYSGNALFEIASGDSFFVNASGIIDLEGKCSFDLRYGDDQRTVTGDFADTSDFYGKLVNDEDILSPLSLGAFTDTAGNVTDVIYMDGDELGFKLDLTDVGSDSLFTISFDLLKN